MGTGGTNGGWTMVVARMMDFRPKFGVPAKTISVGVPVAVAATFMVIELVEAFAVT